jgi:hypothetical protein
VRLLALWSVERNSEGRELHSHEEIEEAITVASNDLTLEDVQTIFYDWMRRLASVIEHEGEYILE